MVICHVWMPECPFRNAMTLINTPQRTVGDIPRAVRRHDGHVPAQPASGWVGPRCFLSLASAGSSVQRRWGRARDCRAREKNQRALLARLWAAVHSDSGSSGSSSGDSYGQRDAPAGDGSLGYGSSGLCNG